MFEWFGEARVPLVEGHAFADLISMDLAYRYSNYASGIETDSYKIGIDWAPTSDLRLRASRQQAVRAANIIELYSQQGMGLFGMDYDPCDAANRPAEDGAVPSTCIGTNPWQVSVVQSLSGNLDNAAGQYNGFFGGNPNLAPEESGTTTYGFVLTPTALPRFSLSVDYFNIEVSGLVGTTGTLNILTDCYENANAASCARISRTPGSGSLWLGSGRVEDLNVNIGGYETSGIDINAAYRIDTGIGDVSFQLIGTWLDELVTDPGLPGVDPYDCAGNFSGPCGTPNPEWRHRFRLGWETPWDVGLALTWRYMGEVQQVSSSNDPISAGLERVFEAEDYVDIAGNWQVAGNTVLRFGVNNLLDNDPPLSGRATGTNGNTFPQVYDSLGRWVFVGATVDF